MRDESGGGGPEGTGEAEGGASRSSEKTCGTYASQTKVAEVAQVAGPSEHLGLLERELTAFHRPRFNG